MTPHFKRSEFLRSDTAKRLKIDNDPDLITHEHAMAQLAYGLEILRAVIGAPLKITSGYRNKAVNRAVGGVANSAHTSGFAADFHVPGQDIKAVARKLERFLTQTPEIPFDQLILETSRGVIHYAVGPKYRREILTQAGGPGTPVVPGIV